MCGVQGQQVLKEGIGRGSEVEEDVDPLYARTFMEHPENLLHLQSEILQNILRCADVIPLKLLLV